MAPVLVKTLNTKCCSVALFSILILIFKFSYIMSSLTNMHTEREFSILKRYIINYWHWLILANSIVTSHHLKTLMFPFRMKSRHLPLTPNALPASCLGLLCPLHTTETKHFWDTAQEVLTSWCPINHSLSALLTFNTIRCS